MFDSLSCHMSLFVHRDTFMSSGRETLGAQLGWRSQYLKGGLLDEKER